MDWAIGLPLEALGAYICIAGWIIALILLGLILRACILDYEFKTIFQFEPPRNSSEVTIQVKAVQDELESRARSFNDAYKIYNLVLGRRPPAGEVNPTLQALMEADKNVKNARRRFLKACKSAERFGFSVSDELTDHLPQELTITE